MYNFSDRMSKLSGSATREILKLTANPDIISFAGGLPAPECLPVDIVKKLTNEVFEEYGASVLQYGITEGFPLLRKELTVFLKKYGFAQTSEEELVVVSGGQQALDLMCRAFLDKGDCVLVENPTFLAFLQIASSYQAVAKGVKTVPEGLDLNDLEQKMKDFKPKLLYIVPTFSNPLGRTYSEQNRKGILALAEKYNVMILEDDPYSRLRFSGIAVPPAASFDKSGRVVYTTSFSKIMSPGLRVGLMRGAPEVIKKLVILKQCADLHTSSLAQAIAYKYIAGGYDGPAVEAASKLYGEREKIMAEALDKYMPEGFTHTNPQGGLFIFGEFRQKIDTQIIFKAAADGGVAYVPGHVFYVDGDIKNGLRLNFSNSSPQKILRGVQILGDIFRQKISEDK